MPNFLNIIDQIKFYVMGVLAVAVAGLGITTKVYYNKYHTEVIARATDQVKYTQAQADATAIAVDNKQKEEAKDNAAKQKADADYASLRAAYNAAILRQNTSIKSSSVSADLPVQTKDAGDSKGTSEDPLVPTKQSDLVICGENTAKAQVYRDYILNITEP